MRAIVVARHAESELNVQTVLNGDPSVAVALTATGREQARRLGRDAGSVELVAHSEFGRTQQTAELAWPDVPKLVVPELNEIRFGSFEGTRWRDGYDEWTRRSGPAEDCPGGGESRVAAIERYLRGYRVLLERLEHRVALVAHGAHVRYLLLGREGLPPVSVLEDVPFATGFELTRDELAGAIGVIEAWAAAPAF